MNALKHVAISASAGSGKTFQLAHRYIELLARDVAPDRIIALTFSRKAAGEILDSILAVLVRAATSADDAGAAAARIGRPAMKARDFFKILRGLLNELARVHVGTLDSFAVGVVRAFPMELGVPSAPDIMDNDGPESEAQRRAVLNYIFNQRGISAQAQRNFFEAFKLATFGREEKGLERNLGRFIRDYVKWYRRLPRAESWGNEKLIWPDGRLWHGEIKNAAAVADELLALLPDLKIHAKLIESATFFAGWAGAHDETARLPDKAFDGKFVESMLEQSEDLRAGRLVINYHKKDQDFPARVCELLWILLQHVLGTEFSRALRETSGLFQVLDQYERVYDERVRRRGLLTFEDIQYLLASGGGRMSLRPDDATRLYIDYRLDSRHDHWLLDEFQDTSDLQWAALHNLVDEVLQDTSGARSLFYVGDVKQAIYGWRGGNARLFNQVTERYGDQIGRQPLHASFRSGRPVIETVNRVFAELPEGLPKDTANRWREIWAEHDVSKLTSEKPGYVAMIEPGPRKDGAKPGPEDRYHVVACLLKELRPLERGISVGVLVRSNEAAREVVHQLRAECPGLTVVHEGNAPLRDNPVVSALLSVVQCAAHPGDLLAWRHVQMSPLAARAADRGELSARVMREIQENGFAELFRRWGRELGPLDDYGRVRWRDLIEAAGEFDRTGERECNAFLDFIEGYQLKERASESAVRVMTIHQAKGLGFDMVLLPDLNTGSLVKADKVDFAVGTDNTTGEPRWALKMPRKVVAGLDPVLNERLERANDEESYESLCVLYVALTRARQGLYLVTSFAGESATAMTPSAYLKARLAEEGRDIEIGGDAFKCIYSTGTRSWYEKTVKRKDAPSPPAPKIVVQKKSDQRRRLVNVSPSSQAEHPRSGDLVFAEQTRLSLGVGSGLHELFEKIGWVDEADVPAAVANWRKETELDAGSEEEVLRQFHACLAAEPVRGCLVKPSTAAVLWRERTFDVVLGDRWLTGTFDRVVIEKDRATVFDFKSNDIIDEHHLRQVAAGYAPQMSAYRRALAKLLGWVESKIAVKLVFTRPAKVIEI